MQGLYKSTGYFQTQAARADWDYLAKFANENDLSIAAKELAPPDNAGWRTIDKQIKKLRDVLADHDIDAPPSPSNTIAFNKWLSRQPQGEIPTDKWMRQAGMPTLPGLE